MNKIRYLDEEQLEKFGKLTKKNPLNDIAFHLTILAGLRVLELVNIKIEHFLWENGANGELWIQRAKGGQKQHIPLAPETERKYKRWIRVRNRLKMSRNNPYLFPSRLSKHRPRSRDSFQFAFKEICEQVGIKDHSIHDLRHSVAVLLLKKGKSLAVVRNQLGHTQISSTEVYLRFIETTKESEESSEYLSSLL